MRRAITGGIAEGKSTVLGYLADLGFRTISADAVARAVFDQPRIQSRLAQLAGLEGRVEPELLRQLISERPELRRSVNRLMHPEIQASVFASEAEFTEIPLLIETCLQGCFDEVWVVTCGQEEQRKRLIARVGPTQAVQLLATQLPTAAKIPFADIIVRTNEPESSVLAHVRRRAFPL